MIDYYILKDGVPVVEPDYLAWAAWFEKSTDARIIAKTKVGDAEVSTCFLGQDHNFGDAPPLLFETMIFGGALDGEMIRYSTLEEARAGHDHLAARVIAGI